jgi:hypothetical protein
MYIWSNIIRSIVTGLNESSENFEKYLRWIDRRKTKHWYGVYENIYCALENAIKLNELSKEIEQEGINEQNLNELFKGYTSRYFQIDYYYRKFYYHYDRDSEKEILNKNTKGTMDLKAIAGLLLSYTKLGMASLLPNNKLEYRNGRIFVDGIDSDDIENREQILSKSFVDSVAFKFDELMQLKRDDARDKIKGKRVIYIYHNRIDDTGDNNHIGSRFYL